MSPRARSLYACYVLHNTNIFKRFKRSRRVYTITRTILHPNSWVNIYIWIAHKILTIKQNKKICDTLFTCSKQGFTLKTYSYYIARLNWNYSNKTQFSMPYTDFSLNLNDIYSIISAIKITEQKSSDYIFFQYSTWFVWTRCVRLKNCIL